MSLDKPYGAPIRYQGSIELPQGWSQVDIEWFTPLSPQVLDQHLARIRQANFIPVVNGQSMTVTRQYPNMGDEVTLKGILQALSTNLGVRFHVV